MASAIAGVAILELCAREIARRSILGRGIGWEPSHWAVAVMAAAACAAVGRSGRARPAALFSALFAIGLAAQLTLGARLQSDGFYYFAYLRSLAFDRDVELSNDYRLLGLGDKPHLFLPTPTGHAQSAWTIGPAIVWAPFFAAGHAAALYLSARDPNVTSDGVSYPYRQAVCVAGLFYGLLGCWLMYRTTARFFGRRYAAVAVIAVVCGSFMLWYLLKEPSMTHAPSMALVAAFTLTWIATREHRSRSQWIALGAIAGVMTLVRWQNALFAVLPAWDAARALVDGWRRSDRRSTRETLIGGLLFAAAATVAFLPQMIAWRSIYGTWLAVSPLGPQIRFADPQLVDILWSARNGLFSTSPVLYLAALGLMAFAWIRPALGLPALVAVALMTYFNACIEDWWGSVGFGGRRFDGTLPFFSLGLAQAFMVLVVFTRRYPAVTFGTLAAILVLWNLTLMSAANAGVVRIGEAVSFGHVMAAQARIFHRWFGNPFTYPVSLAFALKYGVSPSRYDLLSANRFLGEAARPYGRIDIGTDDEWAIEEGWHLPEHEGPISFRWANAHARLMVPLYRADDLRVQVRLHALGYPGAPEQTVIVVVNGHSYGPLPVSAGWNTAELLVGRDAWRVGVNRVLLNFAWERRPSEVGLGGDARSLAAAVDYFRVSVAERQTPPR